MGTIRVLFWGLCIVIACCGWGVSGSDVRNSSFRPGEIPLVGREGSAFGISAGGREGHDAKEERNKVLNIARAEVGVRELTGHNDGERVEEYLNYVGFKKGNPYCSAYLSWCFGQAGFSSPRTAWSPALFPALRIVKEPKPADVFGIYYPSLKRIGHCGLVERLQGDILVTLEGNTNVEGSRDGQGVYRRLRHKRTVNTYADWIMSVPL